VEEFGGVADLSVASLRLVPDQVPLELASEISLVFNF
jgi:hypothetical protein